MVRCFLVLLFGLISFLSPAQDTLVVISPQTARYYLETEDRMYILEEKDSLNQQLISVKDSIIVAKDSVIVTHQDDVKQYQIREQTFSTRIRLTEEELEDSRGDLRRRKRLELLTILGTIIAIIIL